MTPDETLHLIARRTNLSLETLRQLPILSLGLLWHDVEAMGEAPELAERVANAASNLAILATAIKEVSCGAEWGEVDRYKFSTFALIDRAAWNDLQALVEEYKRAVEETKR
jgi:hypothetical protein